MLWEVEIQPADDAEGRRVAEELAPHLHPGRGAAARVPVRSARLYLLAGDLGEEQIGRIAVELLVDGVVERFRLGGPGWPHDPGERWINVFLKPGVMDPVAESVRKAVQDLGFPAPVVRTGRRYILSEADLGAAGLKLTDRGLEAVAAKVLANDAIEEVLIGPPPKSAWAAVGSPYEFKLVSVPVRGLGEQELVRLSRDGQLYLSLAEMETIRDHFRRLGRDATDVELETLAQTWSEHCSHKTLKGRIEYTGPDGRTVRYENLLKQTIFAATQEIRRRLGADDWCVSVFEDNAGIVRFDDTVHACFKVETHNHPSAIEPYGGANTGLGGVIRDVLGTGLGGQPVCNTDVFCFAPPDYPEDRLPPGVLHPRRVMKGVVAGVRDYGNRMGIPTVNGAVCFDERYLGNPLVYCGTVGIIPVGKERKQPRAGDLIVAVGGRTGRDGIHGATFSSAELTHESEQVSGGAVQIGNAITEKKLLDVLLQARDRGLYHAITDCGAGGFSSAVGEMGESLGAEVHLDRAPLKYQGLSYTEIWISEAQERMVLAVPPENWPALRDLCAGEDVEATVLGEFRATGRLRLFYEGHQVADLDMQFLHHGRPPVVRKATWSPPAAKTDPSGAAAPADAGQTLLDILSSLDVCSKEWVIRQYDHEVQGGSVVKPLVGVANDGPSDAAVVTPVLGSRRGLAVGCGINPRYGDLDPYWMAASAIDEAVRNVVAVGADPARVALLDNFCWGNTDQPETLGSLVRAAEACRDVALAFGTPFVSGKDSLNNEFKAEGRQIAIPPTLLISALGQVPDVRRAVTSDLKQPGHLLCLVGLTRPELGGSHLHLVRGLSGGNVPRVDFDLAPRVFARLHAAIQNGLVRACHDLSEGGLAVAAAEMCFAGGLGATLDCGKVPVPAGVTPEADWLLFAESNTRFLIEVSASAAEAATAFADLPFAVIGVVTGAPELVINDSLSGRTLVKLPVAELKAAWQRPLAW
jgi:phosphoribosylformylglycinamidine synthase